MDQDRLVKFSISLNFFQRIPESLNTHFPIWMPHRRQSPCLFKGLLGDAGSSIPEYCRHLKVTARPSIPYRLYPLGITMCEWHVRTQTRGGWQWLWSILVK